MERGVFHKCDDREKLRTVEQKGLSESDGGCSTVEQTTGEKRFGVIPNEVRNPSYGRAARSREIPRRCAHRNDGVLLFAVGAEIVP